MLKRYWILIALLMVGTLCYAANRLPGTSIADAVLQRDSLMTVFSSAYMAVRDEKCEAYSIVDTELLEAPQYGRIEDGKRYGSTPWKEQWTVDVCGKKVLVPIIYIPDANGKGTSFAVEQKNVKIQKSK